MVTFDEIQPGEQILVHDEVSIHRDTGGSTKGKLILTQMRLVFVIGGGFLGPKQTTDHAIDMSMIDNVALEPAGTVGVYLRVDFTADNGQHTIRYHCRLAPAQQMVDLINQRADRGALR